MGVSVSGSRVLEQRRAGVVLHPTSLPSPEGRGVLGHDAFRFVDFCRDSGLSVWQVLPLGPTHDDRSPYMSLSVHAGDVSLVSAQRLVDWDWLEIAHVDAPIQRVVELALQRFSAQASDVQRHEYGLFLQQHAAWLDDFALYQALRGEQQGRSWVDWPAPLRDREPTALADARVRLRPIFEQMRFGQFLFYRQWHELRRYANLQGVLLFGDMPIFVAHDSADVWARPDYFDVDARGQPRTVAGVPPDYFSATGQRWGNPHYRWDAMRADGYRWWIARMTSARDLFDIIRIDHFRGFEAYWEIAAAAPTAVDGRWVKVDGQALFDALLAELGDLPLVAEDLGIITPAVDALREAYHLPGMKVLQFAFDGGARNPYLPHNYHTDQVVYTGTHDNDTTLGWFTQLPEQTKTYVWEYLGHPAEPMPWPMIRCALASTARLAMLPMQDVLGLGAGHRMNTPGVLGGNWAWRFQWDQLPADLSRRLRRLTQLYARTA